MVLVSGVAGLAAGAFAMAAGEYVSVRSQRELFEYQISLERDELKQYPEAEAQELALIYAAKGLPQREAAKLAKQIIADPEHALDTLAREELGLNPGELGSPFGAAASSFVAFAAGAALPLVPFVFANGNARACWPAWRSRRHRAVRDRRNAVAVHRPQRLVLRLRACLRSVPWRAASTYGIGRLFGVALGVSATLRSVLKAGRERSLKPAHIVSVPGYSPARSTGSTAIRKSGRRSPCAPRTARRSLAHAIRPPRRSAPACGRSTLSRRSTRPSSRAA